MNDFEVMSKMSQDGLDIMMCPDIITETKTAKGGGKVTVGVPAEVHHLIANQLFSGNATHYVALYIVNKEQFDAIKNQQ